MEALNNSRVDSQEIEIKKKNLFGIDFFFCYFCLQYPEYIININKNGNISISHKCIDNKTITIGLSESKSFDTMIFKKTCGYCQKAALNICLNCETLICDNCKEEYKIDKRVLNDEYSKIRVSPIMMKQYYCKQHCKKVTHFCNFCKINLCEKDCLLEHFHCKNEKLIYEIKIKPSDYNGNNKTLNILNILSKSFYECYLRGLDKKEMTINIILNLYLIEPINCFFEEKKDNFDILEDKSIKNAFKNSGEERD